MSAIRTIRPETEAMQCAVCGRRLLLGETPESYLHGGQRRTVCELCTTRANREGWIRESAGLQLGARSRRDDRVPLLDRLRARRERRLPDDPAPQPGIADERPLAHDLEPLVDDGFDDDATPAAISPEPDHEPAAEPVETLKPETPEAALPDAPIAAEPRGPREPRHVRAVPTSDELKTQRALELFNVSEHPRVVAGVARSLGAPGVAVRALVDQPSRVVVVVFWELCWYRYEVDLADEGDHVVSKTGQGYELGELSDEDRNAIAVADEHGRLALAA
jgi:hypothetical protein